MELTKELAAQLKSKYNYLGFVNVGKIDGITYYNAIKNKGGYTGLPIYFYVNDNNRPVYSKSWDKITYLNSKIKWDETYPVYMD